MKKIITSALVIALTIGAASAQTTANSPAKEHQKEHRAGFDKLNLTADQKAKLQSVRADFKKQMTDLKNNSQLTADEQKSHRKELYQQYQSQTEAILTPAQKDQLAKMKADRKAKHKDGQFHKGQAWKHNKDSKGFARGAQLQKELNLTQEQQSKMAQLRTDFKSKFESIHNDQSLTQDQKKEKMQELRKDQQAQMKTVLTDEQLQKLQSLHHQEHTNRNAK